MITREKLEELQQRMHHCDNDVIELSVKDVSDLLKTIKVYYLILDIFVELLIDRATDRIFWWNK
jgi:hypothetical protein